MQKIKLAIVEDHHLLRRGLTSLLSNYSNLEIVAVAANGKHLLSQLTNSDRIPIVCLLDINMPEMNGYETLEALKNIYPSIEIVILSQYGCALAVERMLHLGAKAFLLKTEELSIIYDAIQAAANGEYFQNELFNAALISKAKKGIVGQRFSSTELTFLMHVCSDLTYKEIAAKMHIQKRTAEGYATRLMRRLQLKSRTALAYIAIRMGLLPMHETPR